MAVKGEFWDRLNFQEEKKDDLNFDRLSYSNSFYAGLCFNFNCDPFLLSSRYPNLHS